MDMTEATLQARSFLASGSSVLVVIMDRWHGFLDHGGFWQCPLCTRALAAIVTGDMALLGLLSVLSICPSEIEHEGRRAA